MVSKYEGIVDRNQFSGIAEPFNNVSKYNRTNQPISNTSIDWLINTVGLTDHGNSELRLDDSRMAKFERDIRNLPKDNKSNTVNAIIDNLELLKSDDARLIASIKAMQATILSAKRKNSDLRIPDSALISPDGLGNDALRSMFSEVSSAYKEVSGEQHAHHDDAGSFLGTAAIAVVGAGAAVFKASSATVTAISSNVLAMFGLGAKAATDVMAGDIKLPNNIPLSLAAAGATDAKKSPNIS